MARRFQHEAATSSGPGALDALSPAALGELLQGLEPRMRAVALRYTRDPEVARDVVQTAFEKVLRHRDQFAGRAQPSTWIHRIVANEALMWLRGERRRARYASPAGPLDEIPIADDRPSARDLLEDHERRHQLERGLASLRHEERDVLVRCSLEGRSYEDYGRERGLHPDAVKSRAFRARRRLGRALAAG